jgi:hypothetical protein
MDTFGVRMRVCVCLCVCVCEEPLPGGWLGSFIIVGPVLGSGLGAPSLFRAGSLSYFRFTTL